MPFVVSVCTLARIFGPEMAFRVGQDTAHGSKKARHKASQAQVNMMSFVRVHVVADVVFSRRTETLPVILTKRFFYCGSVETSFLFVRNVFG